ncbi:MAG: PIN domain-containing protein [Bacteroidetes bacterium]|nr:PIN domain-containing protein [Bacteroidota bacterium]
MLENEPRFLDASSILNTVLSGKAKAILPFSVLIEVVGAVKRRTNSLKLSTEVKNILLECEFISFVELTKERALKSVSLSAEYGLRGMDAIVVQAARENNCELITFDKEILQKIHSL